MMAPALARATASLIAMGRLPGDLEASGPIEATLSPGRYRSMPVLVAE